MVTHPGRTLSPILRPGPPPGRPRLRRALQVSGLVAALVGLQPSPLAARPSPQAQEEEKPVETPQERAKRLRAELEARKAAREAREAESAKQSEERAKAKAERDRKQAEAAAQKAERDRQFAERQGPIDRERALQKVEQDQRRAEVKVWHAERYPTILADAYAGVYLAQGEVGVAYLHGYGVDKDPRAAYVWLSLALLNGGKEDPRWEASRTEAAAALTPPELSDCTLLLAAAKDSVDAENHKGRALKYTLLPALGPRYAQWQEAHPLEGRTLSAKASEDRAYAEALRAKAAADREERAAKRVQEKADRVEREAKRVREKAEQEAALARRPQEEAEKEARGRRDAVVKLRDTAIELYARGTEGTYDYYAISELIRKYSIVADKPEYRPFLDKDAPDLKRYIVNVVSSIKDVPIYCRTLKESGYIFWDAETVRKAVLKREPELRPKTVEAGHRYKAASLVLEQKKAALLRAGRVLEGGDPQVVDLNRFMAATFGPASYEWGKCMTAYVDCFGADMFTRMCQENGLGSLLRR